jgi:hypothetical protein
MAQKGKQGRVGICEGFPCNSVELILLANGSIDYRCEYVTMKIKKSWVEATSWYHCVAEDSRIPKMSPLTLSKHMFIRKLKKKKLSCIDCLSPTPTSQNSPFLVNRSAD